MIIRQSEETKCNVNKQLKKVLDKFCFCTNINVFCSLMPCKRSTILWKPKVLEKHTHVIYENIGSWETSLLNCCMLYCSIVHALTLFITTGRSTGWKNVITVTVYEVVFMVKIMIGLRSINIHKSSKVRTRKYKCLIVSRHF